MQKLGHICGTRTFKPGDPEPSGYLDWHEWARVQDKAKIPNRYCGSCGKWLFDCVKCAHGLDKRLTQRQFDTMVRMMQRAYHARRPQPAPRRTKR